MNKFFNALNKFVRDVALSTEFLSANEAQKFAGFAKPSSGKEFIITENPRTLIAKISETPKDKPADYRSGEPSEEAIPDTFKFPDFR